MPRERFRISEHSHGNSDRTTWAQGAHQYWKTTAESQALLPLLGAADLKTLGLWDGSVRPRAQSQLAGETGQREQN